MDGARHRRGRAVINTSGNVIHFTGIAWAGQAGRPTREAQDGPHEVAYLSGACMAVPREVWRRRGGFPAPYFMYHEDLDFSLRVRLAGGRVGIEPAARVDHDYEFDKGPGKWLYMERNRLSMIVRLYPGGLLLAVLPVLLVTELVLLPVSIAGRLASLRSCARTCSGCARCRVCSRERRALRARRAISAGEFARWLTPKLSSPYLGPVARIAPLQGALSAYWALVRLLIGARAR